MIKIFNNDLIESLSQNGVTELTELQKICIPKIKSGNDLLCVAPNGCGKTLSIVTGLLQQLKKPEGDNPRALVIVADMERGIAMKNEFDRLGEFTGLRVHTALENEKVDNQKDRIYMGSDIVIGTIKRLNQIYTLYALNTSTVKMFVIDDADEVIKNLTFTQIVRLAEGPNKTHYLVFTSQTSEWIERLAEKTMNIHERIEFNEK